MNNYFSLNYCLLAGLLVTLFGCSPKPASPEEARQWLTGTKEWQLSEVKVNGKPTYRDGQVIERPGGPAPGEVTFNRFMENVSFMTSGQFIGSFPDDSRMVILLWEASEEGIMVQDTVPNSGSWQIPYQTLTQKSFEMLTESTAYDPPRVTKVALTFKHP